MNYLILALAAWRLTSLFVNEDGPFEVFAKLRKILGVAYTPEGEPYGLNWFAKGLACFRCASVWVSFVIVLTYCFWESIVIVILPFAISAVAIAVEEILWNTR